MKSSRSTRGIATLAVVLALFALFFDILAAVIASGALLIFLVSRVVFFLSSLSSTASSLTTHRSLPSHFVRQGSPVTVETSVKVKIPAGFSAKISDLPPKGAILVSGKTTAFVKKTMSGRFSYSFVLPTIGEHAFGGIRLSLSDHFFSDELVCQIPGTTRPFIVILPSSEYPLPGESSFREKESSLLSPFTGPDVRSFRESLPGDDLRKIDWKLSAKYDTLFIREYMGQVEQPPILVIDLPDAMLPYSHEAFARMKEAAVSMITRERLSWTGLAVLLISGANVVSYTPLEKDDKNLVVSIAKLTAVLRRNHMFRYRSTATLKRRFSSLSTAADPFSRKLTRISGGFLAHRPPCIFELQMNRIFHLLSGGTIHIFTLDMREASHLRVISELAAIRWMNIQFHITDESHDMNSGPRFNRNPGEMIAGV